MNGKVFLLFLVVLCLPSWDADADSDVHSTDNVLVINSYSPSKEEKNHVISSFLEHLNEKIDVPVIIEYMDSESFPDYKDWQRWFISLFHAYEKLPQLVVILGGEAWAAYRDCCPQEWQDIPIVLGEVKKGYIDYQHWQFNQVNAIDSIQSIETTFAGFKVTGYFLKDYLEENFRFILQMQPETKDIVFFYDDRYNHHFMRQYLSSFAEKIGGIRIHYWSGNQLSTMDLLDSIKNNPDYALISAGWQTDVNHYLHAHSMLHNELMRVPKRLIYEVSDLDFQNQNHIGGYFVSGKEIGYDLAQLVYTILTKGFENAPSFRQTPSLPAYHLNYQVFEGMKMDRALLPENVVWHNMAPSLFELYPAEITFVSMLLILILILSIIYYVHRKRREYHYKLANEKMRRMLEAMPDMAVIFDKEGFIADIIHPLEALLLALPPEQVIGKHINDLEQLHPGFKETAEALKLYVFKTGESQQSYTFTYKVRNGQKTYYAEAKTLPFDNNKVICFSRDITSGFEAEEKVVKLKNFWQSVINHLPMGIFVKNVSDHFRYIYYNQMVADFYGEPIEKFLGKNDYEIEDPLADQYNGEDKAVLEADIPVSFERVVTDKTGNKKFAITTKTKIMSDDGLCYIIAILVDTTAIRQSEIELRNIRHELSLALDAGALSAWIFDVKSSMFTSLYHETSLKKYLSYENAIDCIHPDDRERYCLFMKDLISGKKEKSREILRYVDHEEYRWHETYAAGIRSPETGEIYQVVGVQKDISENLKKQRELEESKFKIDLVIKSHGIIQWDYDIATKIFTSPNVDSFMYDGMTWEAYLSIIHPQDVYIIKEALQKLINGETSSLNIQVRVSMPDSKSYRWVEIHAVAFKRDEKGRLTQITGLRRDITEWKSLTEELIMLRNKAEESNRLKTAFLANMSHEIRTPLNAIVGFSNLIAQTEDPEEVQEYCKIIETNNELLLQLINDILDLSKIEAGQLEFVYTDFNLFSIFNNLKQIYQYRVLEGVELICDLPLQDAVICSEKNRLTQVISNFLANACKFTSRGYIKMGYEYIEEGVRFYVEDTGKGIAKENLPAVFDRFTKFDAFVQGTGLGLSICQTIVSRLGGQIGVESELGKGSTFWFTIPCQAVKMDEDFLSVKKTLPSASGNEIGSPDKKRILVAEDNDSNYLLLLSTLKKKYELIRARDGKEAIRLYCEWHPDLILMDVRMPEMDGLEATIEIRKKDVTIPIVALTANAFDEDRERALAAGCSAYLSKPVSIKRLEELLAEIG